MRTTTIALLMLPLAGAWHVPAAADVAFEPTSWYSDAVKNMIVANQYWVGMESFALSPHDPPQLFVGFANSKHPDHLMSGAFTCWTDGSHLRLLVADDDEYSRDATWSPDGRFVAYTTDKWDGSGTHVASAHLWITDIVTGQRWCVGRDYADGLRWQPDSQGLLFWRYADPEGDEKADRTHIVPEACRVTAWQAAKPQALNLPRLRGGVFSPDARQAAYWGHLPEEGIDGPERVLIADVATGQVRSLEDKEKLRTFQRGPHGLDRLAWSPDGQRLFLQVWSAMAESESHSEFIVDVATGAHHPAPKGLGSYLQPVVRDLPGQPPLKRLERPKEARWTDATWIPSSHRLLCLLRDPFANDAWTMMAAGGMSPQYAAWVVVDADTGAVETVTGLPLAKATAGPWGGGPGTGAGRLTWSGRYLHLENDMMNLYRMK